jgi:hypothetical protein
MRCVDGSGVKVTIAAGGGEAASDIPDGLVALLQERAGEVRVFVELGAMAVPLTGTQPTAAT